MALEKELETYEANRDALLAHEGQYVLISGDQVLGIFQAYEEALREGYDRVGLEPFLVKQIDAVEGILHFSRDVVQQCRTTGD